MPMYIEVAVIIDCNSSEFVNRACPHGIKVAKGARKDVGCSREPPQANKTFCMKALCAVCLMQ